MSAITTTPENGLSDLGPDGIRRYKTRCKILVDSHDSSINLAATTTHITDDVYAVEMSKTIKGVGSATISLTPSQNYLNLIFPNDYVNIYFDIGDGAGWTRTFFGLVDRIEETYSVGGKGVPTTSYRVVCSDFMKAFDKTVIYFNPHMLGRKDFQDYDFADGHIAGMALASRGIVVGGAPSDIVENVILLLLGFGTQFSLPPSYNPGDTQKRLRAQRVELVRGRLSREARDSLTAAGNSYKRIREQAMASVANTVNPLFVNGSAEEDRLKLVAKSYGLEENDLIRYKNDAPAMIRYLADRKVDLTLSPAGGDNLTIGNRNASILQSAEEQGSSLIDIIDTFSFIERRAMDGYLFGAPVWESEGSILTILNSFSNECVNELFFDLRPLSDDGSGQQISGEPVQGKYAVLPDDKGGNIDDRDGAPPGITYIPSVVMREYPFSTIKRVNLADTEISLKNAEGTNDKIGVLEFGDIFNRGPNEPGRRITTIDNINLSDLYKGKSGDELTDKADKKTVVKGSKHLDVAVVSDREIMSTSLGRSDNDHFNLFDFWSDALLGEDQKFYMSDILPIINPIHIKRNGLRVRSVTTRAARFSIDTVINLKELPDESPSAADTEAPEKVPISEVDAPINSPTLVGYSSSQLKSNWNYRLKKKEGEPLFWKWHNGVDITIKPARVLIVPEELDEEGEPKTKANRPAKNDNIPILAIADGTVAVSAPTGCYSGYGNVVVIRHDIEGTGGTRYSVYAHLSRRAVGWGLNAPSGTPGKRSMYASKGMPGIRYTGGRMTRNKKVVKGQIIGYMGHTGTTDSSDHLHFEIDRAFPPYKGMRDDDYTPDQLKSAVPDRPSLITTNIPDPAAAINGTTMPRNFNSCDPNLFYSQVLKKNLANLINQGQPDEDDGAESEQDDTGNASTPEDTNASQEDEGVADPVEEAKELQSNSVTTGSVDTASTRRQVSRWALLQDHWYQHNLEYLSGRVDMRGAPEIRVGYRLDLEDRNMSFYIESVNHSWQFPNSMKTTLQVTRGQPNNPFPIYVLPTYEAMGATDEQRRTSRSRLATYFITPDPIAIRRSLFLRAGTSSTGGGQDDFNSGMRGLGSSLGNIVDSIGAIEYDEETRIAEKYNEMVIPAGGPTDIKENEISDESNAEKADHAPVKGIPPRAAINPTDPGELKK
jgi:murein DD-endopeptidase MepM/ murein hydrolase activator NlpD